MGGREGEVKDEIAKILPLIIKFTLNHCETTIQFYLIYIELYDLFIKLQKLNVC